MNTPTKSPLLPIALKLARATHALIDAHDELGNAADRHPDADAVLFDQLNAATLELSRKAWEAVKHCSILDYCAATDPVEIPGVARVESSPHRTAEGAAEIADRIRRDVAYLQVCVDMDVPGVVDLRPSLSIRGAA